VSEVCMDIEEWLKIVERVRELLDEVRIRLSELNEALNTMIDKVRIVDEDKQSVRERKNCGGGE